MLAVSIIPLPGWVLVGAGYAGYCYRGYAARFYETSGCAALQVGARRCPGEWDPTERGAPCGTPHSLLSAR